MAGLTERERELLESRAQLRSGQLPIIEKLNAGTKLSVEETTEYTKRDEELDKVDAELRVVLSEQKRAEADRTLSPQDLDTRGMQASGAEKREQEAFDRWFIGGNEALTPDQRGLLTPQAYGQPLSEYRAGPGGDAAPMQVSPYSVALTGGGAGGYLIPTGFWHNLQIALKAYGGVYPLMRQVDTDTGNELPWPTNDPTSLKAVLLTENTQVVPQDVTFGFGQLHAFTYVAGPFLASIQLIHDSAFSVDGFVRDRIAEAIGRAQADVAWTGSGSSQPLGITAAITAKGAGSVGTGGIFLTPAARKVYTFSSGGTATTELAAGIMSFESYIDQIGIVDPAYRVAGSDACWVMNDVDLRNARKVTDSLGRPLWNSSVVVGGNAPNGDIEGYPVHIDNNAPGVSTVASTLGGPIFGSLQHAMVARNVRQVGVMRLAERYADFLAVAWLGFMRYDIRSNDMRALSQFKTNAT